MVLVVLTATLVAIGATALAPASTGLPKDATAVPSADTAAATLAIDAAAGAVASPPYAVGVTTFTLVDPTRGTPARGSIPASSARTIRVTVYYPVAGTPGPTTSTDKAALETGFPLVVMVHGDAVSAATYAVLETDLAASGLVVVAPDFPVSSSALPGPAERDPVEQAADVSFVIASLHGGTDVPGVLAGAIGLGPVGVVGHSDGGITAAGLAFNDGAADPAVGAVVILSGAEGFFPGGWFDGPSPALLSVHGTADEVNPFGASQSLYQQAAGAKWFVAVEGGTHLEPFTTSPLVDEIASLSADFLHAELAGDAAAVARITADASAPGLSLVASS